MNKFKQEIIRRLLHLPSTTMALIIILLGFGLIIFNKITLQAFTGFVGIALPILFYSNKKKE